MAEKRLPRWFFTLYYTLKEYVVACYHRHRGGLRFLFQGTGYSERSNANYKRNIKKLKVPFSHVPLEMRQLTIRANLKRKNSFRKPSAKHKPLSCSVLVQGFDKFMANCMSGSQNLCGILLEYSQELQHCRKSSGSFQNP